MRGTPGADRVGADERALRRPRRPAPPHPQVRTFWKLAAAMFEAQAHGLLPLRRLHQAGRLAPAGAVPRSLSRGDTDVSERLAQDLLFFCAQAAPGPARPRLPRLTPPCAGLRPAARTTPTDYSLSVLGRFDPAMHRRTRKQARRRRQGSLVGAGRRRDAPHRRPGRAVRPGRRFAAPALPARRIVRRRAAERGRRRRSSRTRRRRRTLAMEVATSLLYLEAALEDGDFDDPEHADRVRRLGERLAAVRQDGSRRSRSRAWMEELYRRVSDRQTMGSVVQELRASLGEAEKAIDQFFRNPAEQRRAGRRAGAARVDARRAVGARHGPGVAGAAAHARRGRRPGLDRGRSRPRSPRPACSTASPAT